MSHNTPDYGIIDYSKHIWLTCGPSNLKFGDASHCDDFIELLQTDERWIIDYNQYTVIPKKQDIVYFIDNFLTVYKEIHNYDIYPFSKPEDTHIVCPVIEHEGLSMPLTDAMIDTIKSSMTRASVIQLYSKLLQQNSELNHEINNLNMERFILKKEIIEETIKDVIVDTSCKLC